MILFLVAAIRIANTYQYVNTSGGRIDVFIHVKYLDGERPDGHSKSGGIPDKYLINTWKIPATCKNTCLKNRRIKVVLKVVLKVFNIYEQGYDSGRETVTHE